MADARVATLAALVLPACAAASRAGLGEPPEAPAVPAPALGVPGDAMIQDHGWSELRSLRQLTAFPLPEAASWTIDDRSSPWCVAEHLPSVSRIRIRSWAAPRLAQAQHCEAQARRWDPSLPAPAPEQVLDVRPLPAPPGFHGWITASVRPSPEGALAGDIVAFGAAAGRCLVFAYTTRASGSGADRAVGHRLALIADGVLPGLRSLVVEDRAKALSH